MNYYYIPSYPSIIYPLFSFLIQKKEACIITNNKSVKELAEHLSIQCMYHKEIHGLKNINKKKNLLDNLLRAIPEKGSFYFFDNSFAIEAFYLAANWKHGNIFYTKPSVNYRIFEGLTLFNNPKLLITLLIYSFVLKIELIATSATNGLCIGIGESFISNHMIRICNEWENSDIINEKLSQTIHGKFSSVKNLFISQGNLTNILEEKARNTIKEIFSETNLNIKHHPKHTLSIKDLPTEHFPKYFPAEFLLNSIENSIVSVYSSVLIQAAKHKTIKSISILELVEWKDNNTKTKIKTWLLEKGDNNILFPKTMKDFVSLL